MDRETDERTDVHHTKNSQKGTSIRGLVKKSRNVIFHTIIVTPLS